jgi:uncharacterized damage-inducible protein DinB
MMLCTIIHSTCDDDRPDFSLIRIRKMSAFTLDALRELMNHMEWADASVWRALLAHPPAGQDKRIRDLLLHIHGVQRAFLTIWTSQGPPTFPRLEADAGLPGLHLWASAYYLELAAALGSFDAAALMRPIEMPGLGPYEEKMGRRFDKPTLAETIHQVASHSTYHRGQVNARLREVGGEPPLVDYIAWIWFGRPAAEWPRAV